MTYLQQTGPLPSLVLALAMLIVPIWLVNERKSMKGRLYEVGIHFKDAPWVKELALGLGLAVLCFAIIQFEGLLLSFIGLQDSAKVASTLMQETGLALLIVVTLSPLAEEVLFRGYLQKRIGVVLTSIIFTLLHFGYGSVLELAAAFSVAMVLGWFVRSRKHHGIVPAIAAHVLLNLAAVYTVFIH